MVISDSTAPRFSAGLGLSIASSCAVALGLGLKAKLDGSGVLHMSLHREK